MRITYLKPDDWGPLTQSAQNYSNYFSFARRRGDEITILHPWVKCRDYLLDALMWTKDPTTYREKIYGYPKIEGINMDFVELVMECKKGNLPNTIKVLNELEDEFNIPRTMVEKIDNIFYILGDKWWLNSTINLSLYTLILRVLSWNKVDSVSELEDKYDGPFFILRGNTKRLIRALQKSNFREACPIRSPEKYELTLLHSMLGVYNFANCVDYLSKERIMEKYTILPLVEAYV